jgi:hypothetical protein
LAERLGFLSLGHSNIANNDLQVFFLLGHSLIPKPPYAASNAATPLFALIYKEGCVKLRTFSRVPMGRKIVLQIESFPTHEQPHDKRIKAFDLAHSGATTCHQIVCQRAYIESKASSSES